MGKSRAAKSGRRRVELRRNLPKPGFHPRMLLERPEIIHLALAMGAFVLLASILITWSRDQVKVEDGRVMTDTAVVRRTFEVLDQEATEALREEAAREAPQIWKPNSGYLERLVGRLGSLPKSVEGKTTPGALTDELREQYGGALTEPVLAFLNDEHLVNGEPSASWTEWVVALVREKLPRRPILTSEDYENAWNPSAFNADVDAIIVFDGGVEVTLEPIAAERRADAEGRRSVNSILLPLVEQTFPPVVVQAVVECILGDDDPTVRFDDTATRERAEILMASVQDVVITEERGSVIYTRGDVLSSRTYQDLETERDAFAREASIVERWAPRIGIIGLIGVIGLVMGIHFLMAWPKLVRNVLRLSVLVGLMVGMLAISLMVTMQAPNFMLPAAIAPTLVVAILVMLAYDTRLAIFTSVIQSIMVTLALEQTIGLALLLVAGCVIFTAQLDEVRNRTSLTRAAATTSLLIGFAALVLGLVITPIGGPVARDAINQILVDGLYAALATIFVGFLVLGVLPSIERVFDITTGMTLAELRDPKQPLLRQLQQKAPGTYNHSLGVANLAEAAADAIGADSLLTYVGALYHDIGKMNKPEYFVENQDGKNKHEGLRPAMSLLIIVGHVKDGVELGREYNLPRSIIHFIESHHGTTLVEYFYNAAREQADKNRDTVDEIEFRYPGPKPRSKEAAILMLSDAVESATRAMADPNPARVETLVRELCRRRLLDGQLDESELSLRELAMIEEALTSRLRSVYHGRIPYPSTAEEVPAVEASA